MTAHLLLRLQHDVGRRFAVPMGGAPAAHALLVALQRAPRDGLERCVSREMERVAAGKGNSGKGISAKCEAVA